MAIGVNIVLGKRCVKLVSAFTIFSCRKYGKSLTCLYKNTTQLEKRSKMLNKLLVREQSKKKKWYFNTNKIDTPNVFGGRKQLTTPRRVHVLNAMFMEKITEVMSTGEIGAELQGYSVEILFVKVSLSYEHVSVYWAATECDPALHPELENLLRCCAPKIRAELIRQNALGIVPPINFVKDKVYSRAAEVERLLMVADFGPDFIPSHKIGREPKEEDLLSLQESFQERNDNIGSKKEASQLVEFPVSVVSDKNNSEQAPNASSNQYTLENNNLFSPAMRLDILGLDYKALMEKVMKNYKSAHRKSSFHQIPALSDNTHSDSEKELPGIPLSDLSNYDRQVRFKEFLQSRRNMKVKEVDEKIYYTNEIHTENDDDEEQEETDYYEEEDYNNTGNR